jgi:tetratricopeptide (TPR) repeat protein
LQPQRRELYLAKAHVDMLRNARDEAVMAARKAIEVDENFAEAHAMLGSLLQYDVKRRDEAITALRTAIKLKPEIRESYESLAEIFQQAKDEKGAEEVLRQGMAADSKRMAGRFKLGRMLVKQGRLDEARKLWNDRTSDEDNTFPKFIEVLTRAENLKRANEALAKKPNDPEALVAMGMAVMDGDHWVVDGRQKKALVYFQQALELKPGYARAQYGICKAYIQGVDFVKDETKIVDQELAKLRSLDPKLADELDGYRKNYVRGIRATPVKDNE